MASKSMTDRMAFAVTVTPGDYTSTQTGTGIDVQDYDGVSFLIAVGTINGTTSIKAEESDDNSSWSDVAAADLNGSFSDLSSDTHQFIDYQGQKRYVRISSTAAGTSESTWGAYVVEGHPRKSPP